MDSEKQATPNDSAMPSPEKEKEADDFGAVRETGKEETRGGGCGVIGHGFGSSLASIEGPVTAASPSVALVIPDAAEGVQVGP